MWTVKGYHGTSIEVAEKIKRNGFIDSNNTGDWLGHGSYFWEGAPTMARQWTAEKLGLKQRDVGIIVADISLEGCLDLCHIRNWRFIKTAFRSLIDKNENPTSLPEQSSPYIKILNTKKSKDKYERKFITDNPSRLAPNAHNPRDCEVINAAITYYNDFLETKYGAKELASSVRASFIGGAQLYPGSYFFDDYHIQISVFNHRVISNVDIYEV